MAERQSSTHAARAALQRSIAALAIGAPQANQERADALYAVSGAEMDQHVHVAIDGAISPGATAWAEVDVTFPFPFLMAMDPGAADTTIRVPHFTHPGVEMLKGPDIQVYVTLREWLTDDLGFYTGATFRIGVFSPTSRKAADYDARLHFTFSGYAAPTDDDSQG